MSMDEHRVAGALAELSSEIRALRADVDALRREVRDNDKRLRADLAVQVSRQNSAITDSKKKWAGSPDSFRLSPGD